MHARHMLRAAASASRTLARTQAAAVGRLVPSSQQLLAATAAASVRPTSMTRPQAAVNSSEAVRWISSSRAVHDASKSATSSPSSSSSSPPQQQSRPPLEIHNGIVSRPMTWDEVVRAVETNDWAGLGRPAAVQAAYNDHKRRVLSEWVSMGDFILSKIFDAKRLREVGEQGKYFCRNRGGTESRVPGADHADPCQTPATRAQQQQQQEQGQATAGPALAPSLPFRLRWTPNEFPYSLDPEIDHSLLWASQGAAIEDALLRSEISKRFPADQFDVCYFVNPVHNRSVKEVYHAHVFSRRKQKQEAGTQKQTHADKGDEAGAASSQETNEPQRSQRQQAA